MIKKIIGIVLWPFRKYLEWLKSGLPKGKKEKPLVINPMSVAFGLEPIKCHTHSRYKKSCATCRASAGIHHE